MHKLLITCLLLALGTALGAQETAKIYEFNDSTLQEKPQFPGGESEMFKFISKNLNYPTKARNKGISGLVAVSFIVNETGALSDFICLRDIGAGCGEEGLRVIRIMPQWTPGKVNGVPVKVKYVLPLKFRLN